MIQEDTKQSLVTALEKPYYSIYEAADVLGVHHKTIRNHINDGTLRAGRSGQQWRIAKEDIINFVNDAGATKRTRRDIALTNDDLRLLRELTLDKIEHYTGDPEDKKLLKLKRINKKLERGLSL